MPPDEPFAEPGRVAGDDRCVFDVGDALMLTHHGLGTVVERGVRDLGGGPRDYLTVELQSGSMTLRLPADGLDPARLRPIATAAELSCCLDLLETAPNPPAGNWANRHKEGVRKIGSGEPRQLAELLRDLAHLATTRPLATRDQALYKTVRELFESELMVALELDRAEAQQTIDDRLPERPGS